MLWTILAIAATLSHLFLALLCLTFTVVAARRLIRQNGRVERLKRIAKAYRAGYLALLTSRVGKRKEP